MSGRCRYLKTGTGTLQGGTLVPPRRVGAPPPLRIVHGVPFSDDHPILPGGCPRGGGGAPRSVSVVIGKWGTVLAINQEYCRWCGGGRCSCKRPQTDHVDTKTPGNGKSCPVCRRRNRRFTRVRYLRCPGPYNTSARGLPSQVKGAGLRGQSRRSSRVQIPSLALYGRIERRIEKKTCNL